MLLVVGRHMQATRLDIHRISLSQQEEKPSVRGGASFTSRPHPLGAAMRAPHWRLARRGLRRIICSPLNDEAL